METRLYQIQEYESFYTGVQRPELPENMHFLDQKTFEALKQFISSERTDDSEAPAETIFSAFFSREGWRIQAKNYVGVITLNDGTNIEILPKVWSADKKEAARIFRSMLCTVKDAPFEKFRQSSLQDDRVPLFERFIRMFLDEANRLVKQGLKMGYVPEISNEKFLKGKLLVSEQIRANLVRKDRFMVEHSEFQLNIPENRLVLTTLRFVLRHSHDSRNRRDGKKLLTWFEDVEESRDIEKDFAQYTKNRNMLDYEKILQWCRLFLQNRSFLAFHGDNVAFALLFRMEELYERYVAELLRRRMPPDRFDVIAQAGGNCLFDLGPDRFPLRPDILVKTRTEQEQKRVVLDTKWKVLSRNKKNMGISQADMYQMYAYSKRFSASRVILVYPCPYTEAKEPDGFYCEDQSQACPVTIQCMFFDLLDVEKSLDCMERAILEAISDT